LEVIQALVKPERKWRGKTNYSCCRSGLFDPGSPPLFRGDRPLDSTRGKRGKGDHAKRIKKKSLTLPD